MGCIVLLKVMICTSLGATMYFLRYSVVALMFEWTPCLWCCAGQPNLHSPSNIGSVKYYFFCTFCFFFTLHRYYLWIRVIMADPTLFQSTPSLRFLLSGLRISCDWSNNGLTNSFFWLFSQPFYSFFVVLQYCLCETLFFCRLNLWIQVKMSDPTLYQSTPSLRFLF